ncbi:MAG: efflux RND transporter permease subunit, partial [Myxococcota bacterium]
LPEGVRPEVNDELGDVYPILFSMTADGYSDAELGEIAKTIRDQLLRLDGVAKVEVLGDQDERIFVEYSNARLAQLGLSPVQLLSILQSRNIIQPGGQIDIGPESIPLEPSGNFGSVQELRDALVTLPSGGVVSLDTITSIRRGYIDPPRGVVTSEGRKALTFAVSMADGDNLLALGQNVKEFFEELPASYPHGIDFELTYYQPQDVEQKVEEFTSSVLQAIGIVLAVMLITLGLRTGLIVSTLIPAAMVCAILVLSLIGESINQMSLAALIIALGLLVDNAIVVSESIMVRMGQGVKPFDAAVSSCAELQAPLLISSLTTAAAFLPIYLAESAVGEYTGILFTVVTITLLASWLLALTMTPLLCVTFLKVDPKQVGDDFSGGFYRAYRGALRVVLRRRFLSLAVVIAAFVGSLPLWGLVPQIFFPAQGGPFFIAELSLPPGTNINATREMISEVDAFLESDLLAKEGGEGITSWTAFVGETPPSFTLGYTPSPSLGGFSELMIHTTSKEIVPELMEKLQRFALDRFPDVQTYIRPLSAGPPVDKPIQIRLSGPDVESVFKIADTVKAKLGEVEGVREIQDNWGARVKKLNVEIDENRLKLAGFANDEVALALQTFLSGLETTRYREEDDSIPVMVRSVGLARRDLDRVRNLTVFSSSAPKSVPLSQVADVNLTWENSAILRRDRYRTVTVEASMAEGYTAIA